MSLTIRNKCTFKIADNMHALSDLIIDTRRYVTKAILIEIPVFRTVILTQYKKLSNSWKYAKNPSYQYYASTSIPTYVRKYILSEGVVKRILCNVRAMADGPFVTPAERRLSDINAFADAPRLALACQHASKHKTLSTTSEHSFYKLFIYIKSRV